MNNLRSFYRTYWERLRQTNDAHASFLHAKQTLRCNQDVALIAICELLAPGSVDLTSVSSQVVAMLACEYRTYETLLGDFLPNDLRVLAKPMLDRVAFDTPSLETSRYRDDFAEYRRRLEQSRKIGGGKIGISSGCSKLDLLTGGFDGMTVIGGKAGSGKTDFVLSCIAAILQTSPDVAILFLSADLSKERLFDRLLCCLAGIGESDLYHGSNAPGERIERASAILQNATSRLQILERSSSGPLDSSTVTPLRDELLWQSRCSRLLIVLDYLQVLPCPPTTGDIHEGERHRFGEIKLLTKPPGWYSCTSDFPFILISEVRKGEGSRELELEDLSGSARHYYGADNVILLEPSISDRDLSTEHSVSVNVAVKKARRGHKGEFTATFEYPLHSFRLAEDGPHEEVKMPLRPRHRRA